MKRVEPLVIVSQNHMILEPARKIFFRYKPSRFSILPLITLSILAPACASTQSTTESASVIPKAEKPTSVSTVLPTNKTKNTALKTFEQDRNAILAFAGKYEVTFQYMETASLRDGYSIKEPYSAKATEFVKVIEDSGNKIDLQHVLVMPSEEGTESRVVKHWRQTWTYQDDTIYEYVGNRSWAPRKLDAQDIVGTWTQAVYQVDDSPRYESIGRWRHQKNFSSWASAETWRPLPRREYTKRNDYHVLVARNRHTLTSKGWLHEQDNYKLDLEAEKQPIIALEAGLNTYTRTESIDFTPGYQYWEKTKTFWSDVRAAWVRSMDGTAEIRLRKEVDEKPLWKHIFKIANDVEENGYKAKRTQEQLKTTLNAFIIPDSEKVAQEEGY